VSRRHCIPNRRLTTEELVAFKPLLDEVRLKLKALSQGDDALHWALRRKLAKELGYDERGKPMHRRMLKALKRGQQHGKCAACKETLPEKGAVLDRLEAMEGYTTENTRLICSEYDFKIQTQSRKPLRGGHLSFGVGCLVALLAIGGCMTASAPPPSPRTRIEVTEPALPTLVIAGRPIRIAWRVVNGPPEPEGWELRVLINKCSEALSTEVVAALPLTSGQSSYLWTPSPEVVTWLEHCTECRYWVDVCLYNAAARGEKVGVLLHEDEILQHIETCHPFSLDEAYLCGSSARGQIRATPESSQ
jgi:ribosomal protein L44E